MKRNYPAAVLSVLVLAACAANHRYELSKDNEGRLVRLDTQTGDVMLIEGNQLTPVSNASSVQTGSQLPKVALPQGGKSWPTLTISQMGNSSASLTTSWEDGKLHYVLELYPFSKRLKLLHSGYYNNSSFSMTMSNASGKQMARLNLPASSLAHKIGNTRNVEELSTEGDIPMNKADYDTLAEWGLLWSP